MRINISQDEDEATLLCPRCGENYLHQGTTTLYERPEDAVVTLEIAVASAAVVTRLCPSSETRNPSSRRHGLAIQFECETCGPVGELTIAQHKGLTLLAWRGGGDG